MTARSRIRPTAPARTRRRGRGPVLRHPVPVGFLLAAAAATALRAARLRPAVPGGPADDPVARWASTNLDNLRSHPVGALTASAFVLGSAPVGELALGTLALAALTGRVGGPRACAVAAAGHVGGTLLSQALLARRIARGRASAELRAMEDVGASYLAVPALVAVALDGLRPRGEAGEGPDRLPRAAAAVLLVLAPSLVRGLRGLDTTAVGHAAACAVGALAARALRPGAG